MESRLPGTKQKAKDILSNARYPWWTWPAFFLIISCWLITPWISNGLTDTDSLRSNELGDLFGSVNALFSGLAFWGIVLTISLQRWDLKIQFEVLRDQQTEMADSAESMRKQVEIGALTAQLNTLPLFIDTQRDYVRAIFARNGLGNCIIFDYKSTMTSKLEVERNLIGRIEHFKTAIGRMNNVDRNQGVAIDDRENEGSISKQQAVKSQSDIEKVLEVVRKEMDELIDLYGHRDNCFKRIKLLSTVGDGNRLQNS